MQTLVLDAQGIPTRVIGWEEAMTELCNQGEHVRHKAKTKVIVLEYHDSQVVHSASAEWRVPSIIQFIDAKFRLSKHVRYSRNNIYARDRGQCQYCGTSISRAEFTLDHVLPKSQGGQTTWTNTVVCCVPCNTKKRNNTPMQAGMRLLRSPIKPSRAPFDVTFRLKWHPGMPETWRAYMRDTVYWNGELENDNQ